MRRYKVVAPHGLIDKQGYDIIALVYDMILEIKSNKPESRKQNLVNRIKLEALQCTSPELSS